jgi:hypothetical protein
MGQPRGRELRQITACSMITVTSSTSSYAQSISSRHNEYNSGKLWSKDKKEKSVSEESTEESLYADLLEALERATPSAREPHRYSSAIPLPLPPEVLSAISRGLEGPPKTAFLIDLLTGRDRLNRLYQERLNQARITFAVALTALVLGILLVFIGIILTFTNSLPIGIITTISSVAVEIVSALAFKFNGDTNNRLDRLNKELNIIEQTSLSMEYINQITEPKVRNKAIADLIKRLHASAPGSASVASKDN